MAQAPRVERSDMPPGDCKWVRDQLQNSWKLPRVAPWPLRLWGIRHIRVFFNSMQAQWMADEYARVGAGLGHINPYDKWVLYAIYRGWA